MSCKHIFIGIGGAGVSTVSKIKQKLYMNRFSAAGSKSRADQMNEKYRFLFIDTDPRDINKANEENRTIYESGRVPFINPQTELVSLSQGNAHAIYEEAKQFPNSMINQRILEACTDELAAKIPDQPLALGAGAFRMKSRISFARSMSEFQQKLQAHIEDLNNVKLTGGEETRIMYWLVSSGIGGTGSGILNDVLYYINMQHQRSIGDGDPHLVFTMYMPKFYIDKNSTEEKYSANAFALMSEIEAFKAMSQDPKRNTLYHRLALVKDYNLINSSNRYDPFYYMIPIDCQTDKGANIGSAMYNNTAELLYRIHEGNGGDALHSDVDNYMHDLYLQRPKGFLVPMGYIALRKPEAEFEQYVEARFKRDLIVTGLRNADITLVDDKDKDSDNGPVGKVYADTFANDLLSSLKNKKQDILDERFAASKLIKEGTESEIILDDAKLEERHVSISMIDSIADDFKADSNNKDEEKKAVSTIKANIWKTAEEMVLKYGIVYAADFFKKLNDFAKAKTAAMLTEERPVVSEDLNRAHDSVVSYRVTEGKSSQRSDVQNYFSLLRSATEERLDFEIRQKMIKVYSEIAPKDGDGLLKDLVDYLDALDRNIAEKGTEASKEYKALATKVGETSLDVTSVYLPDLKQICDSNGWVKNNYFSMLYNMVLKASTIAVENDDNKPVREGDNSLLSFCDKVYSDNSSCKKEIAAMGYSVGEKVRILANENKEASPVSSILENFVYYVTMEFMNALRNDERVQSKWYDKTIEKFFDDLDSREKDKVRQSLMPSLFFNYKGNRIAVDYREFLIFVARNQEQAIRMLGYQDGNPNHKFIGDKDSKDALVIRAKYGLSFSDYRMYDNLKAIYEKAPLRDKYHFHHYFAEFGENLTISDLPYEVSTAHRVFAKLLLLKKFENDIKDFFYTCSTFQNKKNDYAKFMLLEGDKGSFSVARPKALSEREGKICLTVVDRNARLFADFEGNDFGEAFDEYQKSFVRNAVQETYVNFLDAIMKYNFVVESEDGLSTMTGESVIKSKFDTYRAELLAELDMKIFEAATEKEKALYRIFFSVIERDIINVRSLNNN